MRAKYFRFLSQTNSTLKNSSAIRVLNLVKIGEKFRPLYFDERKNFIPAEVGRRACALNKSVLAVNGKLRRHLSGNRYSKFGEDRLILRALEIIDRTRSERYRQNHTHTHSLHSPTHTDRDDRGDLIICPMLCYCNGTDKNYDEKIEAKFCGPLKLAALCGRIVRIVLGRGVTPALVPVQGSSWHRVPGARENRRAGKMKRSPDTPRITGSSCSDSSIFAVV